MTTTAEVAEVVVAVAATAGAVGTTAGAAETVVAVAGTMTDHGRAVEHQPDKIVPIRTAG
jgi:hypothetical protein